MKAGSWKLNGGNIGLQNVRVYHKIPPNDHVIGIPNVSCRHDFLASNQHVLHTTYHLITPYSNPPFHPFHTPPDLLIARSLTKNKMRSLFASVLSLILLPVATLAGDISGLIESCSG